MNVLLLGASGRIGQRITAELLDRDHHVTAVFRSGKVNADTDPNLVAISGDATSTEDVAKLATAHDVVASALGPGENADPAILSDMAKHVLAGMRRAKVDRLIWTGGAGGLRVDEETPLIETEAFPDAWKPAAQAHIDALDVLRDADDIAWTDVAPAALIEPGERTGQYRTAEDMLVVDEDGESQISMEDFAVAFVDVLEQDRAHQTYLGTGY